MGTMKIVELNINGVHKITPVVHSDERGEFYRYYCSKEFKKFTDVDFVQMNHSINHKKGTLRGMHYQLPPKGEEKLIRCVKGKIFDVFVDLRANSPTFLQWDSVILSEENKEMLFLPKGIAHGFITLEDETHILYQHSEYYSPEHERGFRYDDKLINIDWPIKIETISARDEEHPFLDAEYNGLEI